jgi:hypothetical protein
MVTVDRHGDVAVAIGATGRDAELAQLGEQQGRRMAVIVVQPDGNDCDLRVRGLQEPRVGIGAAVMGHLQHVGADVGARVEHGLLLLDLGVAGQEYAHAANGGPHD